MDSALRWRRNPPPDISDTRPSIFDIVGRQSTMPGTSNVSEESEAPPTVELDRDEVAFKIDEIEARFKSVVDKKLDEVKVDSFIAGARWGYLQYDEIACGEINSSVMGDICVAATVWLRVQKFNLTPGTVFMGSVGYKLYRSEEPYAYSGPVLVGSKPNGTLTLSTVGGTIDLDNDTLTYTIDDVIHTPGESNG